MTHEKWTSDCGTVTLYRGDCLEILPTLEAGSVDAVVTDPPYSSGGAFRGDRVAGVVSKYVQSGVATFRESFSGDNRDQRSFFAWCSLWMTCARYAASGGAVMVSFIDWRQLPTLTDAVQCGGWTWRNVGTWWKPGCRMQKGRFSGSAEYVVYATNGPHFSDGELSPQNVLQCSTMAGDDKDHIAEKPRAVVEWALSVTRKGGLVLDPFMGSGSTGEACCGSGRKFIGIELDAGHYDNAKRRIQDELAKVKFLEPPKRDTQRRLIDE